MQFARKASYAPTPQPGKFPIVFPAGAGEPTRDSFMALDGFSLMQSFSEMPDNYLSSERYAEFSMNATYEDSSFRKEVVTSTLLCLAQRIVHSHLNMGQAMGDFSSIASTDIYTMHSIMAVLEQFGEFSESYLGTRYLYKEYATEILALVRTAKSVAESNGDHDVIVGILTAHWLPAKLDDKRTAFIVAHKLRGYFQERGITLKLEDLCSNLFKQKFPAFKAALSVLPEEEQGQFDLLFTGYRNQQEFRAKFAGTNSKPEALDKLHLDWPGYSAELLRWGITPKTDFPELAEPWLRKKPTIGKFFNIVSGLAQKSEAMGTAGQISAVSVVSGVTVVKTKVALSAPQFSLISCFPPSAYVEDNDELRVVLTTSIPVNTRAIEFQQKDWRS